MTDKVFFHFGHFLPFDPPKNPKNQHFAWRDIIIIKCDTNFFCYSWLFFALLPLTPIPDPSNNPGKSNFWKNEKYTSQDNIIWWKWKRKSYDAWFLRYGAWQTEFFLILDDFLAFYPLKNQKIKILKKLKKKHLEIWFYTSVP